MKKPAFALACLAAVAALSLTACTDDEAEPVAPAPTVVTSAPAEESTGPLEPDEVEPSVSVSPSASVSPSVSVVPSRSPDSEGDGPNT